MGISMLRRALLLLGVILLISSISSGSTDLRSAQELKSIQTIISVNGHSWTANHTSVSDLSPAEKQHRLGLIWQPPTGFRLPYVDMTATVASAWDWRNTKGANWVTPIKDQGDCGSCVGFATVATIESAVEISRGNPKPTPECFESSPICRHSRRSLLALQWRRTLPGSSQPRYKDNLVEDDNQPQGLDRYQWPDNDRHGSELRFLRLHRWSLHIRLRRFYGESRHLRDRV